MGSIETLWIGAPAWAAISRRERDRLQDGPPGDVLRYEGATWQFAFSGQRTQLPDAKGLHDMPRCCAPPGAKFTCIRCWACPPRQVAQTSCSMSTRAPNTLLGWPSWSVRSPRLMPLATRAGRNARAPRDALVHELGATTGLGGRQRRLGDQTERARKTVGAACVTALARIECIHPLLAGPPTPDAANRDDVRLRSSR